MTTISPPPRWSRPAYTTLAPALAFGTRARSPGFRAEEGGEVGPGRREPPRQLGEPHHRGALHPRAQLLLPLLGDQGYGAERTVVEVAQGGVQRPGPRGRPAVGQQQGAGGGGALGLAHVTPLRACVRNTGS
ncbi:hypothetical protein GCM10023238_24280 [Streptomyces heliomycini]